MAPRPSQSKDDSDENYVLLEPELLVPSDGERIQKKVGFHPIFQPLFEKAIEIQRTQDFAWENLITKAADLSEEKNFTFLTLDKLFKSFQKDNFKEEKELQDVNDAIEKVNRKARFDDDLAKVVIFPHRNFRLQELLRVGDEPMKYVEDEEDSEEKTSAAWALAKKQSDEHWVTFRELPAKERESIKNIHLMAAAIYKFRSRLMMNEVTGTEAEFGKDKKKATYTPDFHKSIAEILKNCNKTINLGHAQYKNMGHVYIPMYTDPDMEDSMEDLDDVLRPDDPPRQPDEPKEPTPPEVLNIQRGLIQPMRALLLDPLNTKAYNRFHYIQSVARAKTQALKFPAGKFDINEVIIRLQWYKELHSQTLYASSTRVLMETDDQRAKELWTFYDDCRSDAAIFLENYGYPSFFINVLVPKIPKKGGSDLLYCDQAYFDDEDCEDWQATLFDHGLEASEALQKVAMLGGPGGILAQLALSNNKK